jgi:hypothetical protein
MAGTVGMGEIVLAGAIGLEPTAFGFGEAPKIHLTKRIGKKTNLF